MSRKLTLIVQQCSGKRPDGGPSLGAGHVEVPLRVDQENKVVGNRCEYYSGVGYKCKAAMSSYNWGKCPYNPGTTVEPEQNLILR